MYRKFAVCLVLVSIIFLFACSKQASEELYVFTGEGENWSITYEVIKTGDDYNEKGGIIQYIGEEPMPERLDYTIYQSKGSVPLGDNGIHTISECKGCAVPYENMEVEAVIVWDGKSERIPLIIK